MHHFLDNKYTDLYFRLVESRKTRDFINDEYYEKHHIIPKSLGGSDLNSNLVSLTYREHIIAHYLLTKMTSGDNLRKMQLAFTSMVYLRNEDNKRNLPSLRYLEAAKKFSIEGRTGRKHSVETRIKIGKSREYKTGSDHVFYGNSHTENTKRIIRDKRSQQLFTQESIDKRNTTLKNKYKNVSHPNKGRLRPHENVICPHCNKTGAKPNMMRWHFDNCKEVKNENCDL